MEKRISQRITRELAGNSSFRADQQLLDSISAIAPHMDASSPLSRWFGQQLMHRMFGDNSTDQSVAKINIQYLESQGIKTQSDDDIDLSW